MVLTFGCIAFGSEVIGDVVV